MIISKIACHSNLAIAISASSMAILRDTRKSQTPENRSFANERDFVTKFRPELFFVFYQTVSEGSPLIHNSQFSLLPCLFCNCCKNGDKLIGFVNQIGQTMSLNEICRRKKAKPVMRFPSFLTSDGELAHEFCTALASLALFDVCANRRTPTAATGWPRLLSLRSIQSSPRRSLCLTASYARPRPP